MNLYLYFFHEIPFVIVWTSKKFRTKIAETRLFISTLYFRNNYAFLKSCPSSNWNLNFFRKNFFLDKKIAILFFESFEQNYNIFKEVFWIFGQKNFFNYPKLQKNILIAHILGQFCSSEKHWKQESERWKFYGIIFGTFEKEFENFLFDIWEKKFFK